MIFAIMNCQVKDLWSSKNNRYLYDLPITKVTQYQHAQRLRHRSPRAIPTFIRLDQVLQVCSRWVQRESKGSIGTNLIDPYPKRRTPTTSPYFGHGLIDISREIPTLIGCDQCELGCNWYDGIGALDQAWSRPTFSWEICWCARLSLLALSSSLHRSATSRGPHSRALPRIPRIYYLLPSEPLTVLSSQPRPPIRPQISDVTFNLTLECRCVGLSFRLCF